MADAVGTGKTATSIALVLSGQEGNGGDTLIVLPKHLVNQWKTEIEKFAQSHLVQVIVGKEEYETKAILPPPPGKRRIVLVDVDTVLNEDKLWYNFRRVFDSPRGAQLKVSKQDLEKYKQAALACVKSPRGPCSYDGWVYTGRLHHPYRPWRRVILDEIQDLVSSGTESQKNLLQLSRTATHVWLLSATPFPHGNASIKANHELLGFCRLHIQVQKNERLPSNHVFEKIKRKLYIKSPRHVADQAVVATKSVVKKTIRVEQMNVEQTFYEMELERIRQDETRIASNDYFSSEYDSLREMTVHPEASHELRQQAIGKQQQQQQTSVGQFSSVSSFAKVSLERAKSREKELIKLVKTAKEQLHSTEQSLVLAQQVKKIRQLPVTANPFAGTNTATDALLKQKLEEDKIHDMHCSCKKPNGLQCRANRQVCFRIIPAVSGGNEWIRGSTKRVVQYFQQHCNAHQTVNQGQGTVTALDHYISTTAATVTTRTKNLCDLETELATVRTRVQMLRGTTMSSTTTTDCANDLLASTHGSKPAALVRFLRQVHQKGEQAIVFSYWHDTLRLVQLTLKRCNLPSSFCDGDKMSQALTDFVSGKVSILLLSAQAKASGANLQCATHVVLLDPAGASAEHGAALEQQAIGRAVRMGQERAVTVTRFCVTGTMEEIMFEHIDNAAFESRQRSNDASYVIEGANKVLPVKEKTDKEGTNDVQLTQSFSAAERVQREFTKAQEEGLIVELLDSEDEDDEYTPSSHVTPISNRPIAGRVTVKTEPKSTGKRPTGKLDKNPPSKRVKLTEDCASVASPFDANTDSVNTTIKGTAVPDATEETAREQLATVSPPSSQSIPPVLQNANENTDELIAVSVRSPKPTDDDKDSAGTDGVKLFLERSQLSIYKDKFEENGYDNLKWLYDIANDATLLEKVATDVGFKIGHAIRFQTMLFREATLAKQPGSLVVSSVVDV